MNSDVETFTVNGYRIRIKYDDNPESPREWDNLGTMVCWHNRNRLGDKHNHGEANDFLLSLLPTRTQERLERWCEREEAALWRQRKGLRHGSDEHNRLGRDYYGRYTEKLMKEAERVAIILPLYLFDHSGMAMNTKGFSCPWDSGQVGYIYVTLADVRHEYSCRAVTKAIRKKAIASMTCEVSTYSDWLGGFVYGYVIENRAGDEVDSCWGHFGLDYTKEEATATANALPAIDETEDELELA